MDEIERKLRVLSSIAGELNARGITWAVGGSLLLYFKGLVGDFNDIDLMVAEADADAAQTVLSSLGEQLPVNPKSRYKSKCFLRFQVEGVDVDVIGALQLFATGRSITFPSQKNRSRIR